MKKSLAVLLIAAVAIGAIGLPSSPASAGDYYDGWSSGSEWRGRDRDRYDHRDRGWDNGYGRDRRYRRDGNNHKKRDAALIAGVAGLALGAAIIGLSNRSQGAPARPGDRLIYDPNY
ncbi:MAG: hypothetical protein AAAB35_22225 [Phyllobacterium sp.]|uniref:hypothetical protein n=1 Tax=Phyllobacterium sp. TaxID=1871046 RepID=UPI0030F08AC5